MNIVRRLARGAGCSLVASAFLLITFLAFNVDDWWPFIPDAAQRVIYAALAVLFVTVLIAVFPLLVAWEMGREGPTTSYVPPPPLEE